MDVISLRLRPIQPSHAARAIGRFLAQRGAEDDDLQQDGLGADTLEQLRGMKAALQYCKKNNLPYEKRRVDVEALANLNAPKLPREFIKSVCSADSVESATHYQHIERSD